MTYTSAILRHLLEACGPETDNDVMVRGAQEIVSSVLIRGIFIMNANDILKYGHLTVLRAVDGLPPADWETPGVCGVWSVKEIVAHLASYEHMLVDVLASLLTDDPTPTLDAFKSGGQAFNDAEVGRRQDWPVERVLGDYSDTCAQAMALLERVPLARRRETGALAWYGADYDLEDFLVYTFYGHKREHCAQIAVFRDGLAG